MPFRKHGRQYDLVVFGATGYTGLLTAKHISAQFPTDLKWAVAGRSADKLQKVVSQCQSLNKDRIQPEIEVCSLSDSDLLALAKKAYAFIATVGPYSLHGEHAFKACAEAGTHYLDCTGETAWTLDMIKRYEARAKETGAIMIPQSGIESAPSDVLAWSMAQLIRSELSAQTGDVVVEFHELRSLPSGGTMATIFELFDHYSLKQLLAAHEPYALSPKPNPHAAPRPSLFSMLTGLYTLPDLGLLCTFPVAQANAAIVQRTWGLLQQEPSRQKQFYGPRFTYREFMKTRNFLTGIVTHYVLLIGAGLLAFVPAFRALMRKFVFKPGDGPGGDSISRERIELRGTAEPDQETSGKRAIVKAWYTGSMYYFTAILLAQGALTLLEEDVELGGGVFTPACLGQGYVDRLSQNGFKIEARVVDA